MVTIHFLVLTLGPQLSVWDGQIKINLIVVLAMTNL